MFPPLLKKIFNEPGLIAEHVEAYSHLLSKDAHLWQVSVKRQFFLKLIMGSNFFLTLLFAGIALMIWGALYLTDGRVRALLPTRSNAKFNWSLAKFAEGSQRLSQQITIMAQLHPYLNFDGKTEEAFNFYRSVFGGEFGLKVCASVTVGNKQHIVDSNAMRKSVVENIFFMGWNLNGFENNILSLAK